MSASHRPRRPVLLPAAILLLAGCAGGAGGAAGGTGDPAGGPEEGAWQQVSAAPEGAGPVMTISGTVRYLQIEGGVYVIEDASGTRYNPTNLPESFRTDGKAVEAEGRRRDDMMSIGMVGPMVELVRIRERAGGAEAAPGESGAAALAGTSWRLEDLAGSGVIDDSQASIAFPEAGRVAGNATCNRFTGTASITGDAMSFGPLATTRRMCPEALMDQESRFLKAIGAVQRFEVKDGFLLLHGAGGGPPLRFGRE